MRRTDVHNGKHRGFSLLELLIATAILISVFAIVMGYISTAQRRFDTQETTMDMTQESREFMDQMARDLHMVGNPHPRMFAPGVLGIPWWDNVNVATGIVSISNTQLTFEGDVDHDGVVDAITYDLIADTPPFPAASLTCPCRVRRVRAPKQPGGPFNQQQVFRYMSVQGVINSAGAIPVAALPGNFAAYINEPVFRAYDANGAPVPLPVDLNSINPATGNRWVFDIRTLRVTLNMLGPVNDNQTGIRPVMTMTTAAKINNF
jgi:hypothetical protein